MSKKAISYEERLERIRRAVYQASYHGSNDAITDFYIELVYDGYVIVRTYDGDYFRANYTDAASGVTVQPIAEWQRVEKEWAAKSVVLARNNHALKALGNGKVGGYLVLFSSADDPDLAGDFFTADTEFDIEDGQKTAVYYQHGLDATLKRRKLGSGTLKQDDVGIWLEAQLELRDEYEQAIYGLVEAGKCGLSSGTAAHLIEREAAGKAAHIKRWPLGLDASITPTPCEPRTSVLPLKSLIESTSPQATPQAAGDAATVTASATEIGPIPESTPNHSQQETSIVEENATTNTQPAADVAGLQSEIKALRELIENAPALKSAGVEVPNVIIKKDEGGADAEVKSFKRFLRSGDASGLKATLVEGTDANGGYLVPTQYADEIIRPLTNDSYLRMAGVGTRIMPVSGTDMIELPVMAYSAQAAPTAEKGTYAPASEPTFTMVAHKPYKATKLAKVSEELLQTSRFDVMSEIITPDWAQAFAERENTWFTRGNGTTEPQGFTVGGQVGITLATGQTTTITDPVGAALDLYFSLDYKYRANAVFMMNDAVWALIRKQKDSTGNYITVGQSAGGLSNVAGSIMGRPVITNNSMDVPAASKLTMAFGDFRYFRIVDFAGLYVQRLNELYSETGEIGFRGFKRVESKVVLPEAIKLLRQSAT